MSVAGVRSWREGRGGGHHRVAGVVGLIVVLGVLAFPVKVLATRGHVRSSLPPFGGPCTGSGGACEPGQLAEPVIEPNGVAVSEATGGVYVVGRASNRVDIFGPDGKHEGQLDGPNATGTGTLTEGSSQMEVATTTGAFTVGEEISGEGIPAGTTIEAVEAFGVLTISQPVEAGKSGTLVPLVAAQQFDEPTAIAIDNSCEQHEPHPLPEPECVESDPSAGDIYVEDGFSRQAIDKFTAAGEYVGQITEQSLQANPNLITFGSFSSDVAVGSQGRLFVAEIHREDHGFGSQPFEGIDAFSNAAVNAWEAFNPGPFQSSPIEHGLAVDLTGRAFARHQVNGSNGVVAELGSKGELIDEAVGGEVDSGVTFGGVAVESATGDVYIDNVGSVGRFGPSSGSQASEVERFGTNVLPAGACEVFGAGGEASCGGGVAVDSSSGQVYVADSSGEVLQFVLEEPTVPSVQSDSVIEVTDDSARLGAEINPRSLTGEPATSYRFEYGACSSPESCASEPFEHAAPVPDGSLAAGFETESVSELIQGLHAGTTYHFRVLAENGHGAAIDVKETVFTTRGTGEFVLVDGRQWQLVTPPDKHGALIEPIGRAWPIQASASGDAITYATDSPIESEPAGYTGLQQVLSTRTAGGWSSYGLGIPHVSSPGAQSVGQEYRFFSEDLSQAALQPLGSFVACRSADGGEQPCLSPTASEQTAFLHDDHASLGEPCTSSCYTPFVTGVDGYANVPSGTIFGVDQEGASCPPKLLCGPSFADATPDLNHVLLKSHAPLTSDPVNDGLYEWSAGSPPSEQLRLVSVLPESETGVRGELGPSGERVRHAMSSDGERVVWDDGAGHLYLRLNATRPQSPIVGGECVDSTDACTVQLDAGLSGSAQFQLADSAVSRVLFTDEGDLYEYEVEHRALQRVTEGAGVQGVLTGASDDGSWVYFVANGVLGNGTERGAVAGNCVLSSALASHACNLYVRHNGTIKLVAVLSALDFPDWGGIGVPLLKSLTARVSPNGQWLAFMSQRSLTGYDNRDAVSGKADEEVFLYHASTEKLLCASCDPTGGRPHGAEYGFRNLPLVGGSEVWEESTWLAGNIPGWTPISGSVAFQEARYLSDSGRLFFNSSGGLVPKDVNGQEDAYEFEPQGAGSCSGPEASSGSVTFSTSNQGCVGLVSSGRSGQESALLDASETGDDVFFLTTAQLVPQDDDTAFDIYDAHVCTSASPCLPAVASSPPPCSTEASCKAAPSPQPELFGASGSAVFSGPGNLRPSPMVSPVKHKTPAQIRAERLAHALKACKRLRSKRKRISCRKQAMRRYGPVKVRKAAGKGRVKR